MKCCKTLIYGFGPYDNFADNITESVILSLKHRHNLVTKVFDVRFSRAMFSRTLKEHTPEIIIGLGQHPRARKLRLERKAINLFGKRGEKPKLISKTCPPALFSNLRLPSTPNTTIAYNAGTYVCNFSMHICLEYSLKTGAKFGFIHVPKDYSVPRIINYLTKTIQFIND